MHKLTDLIRRCKCGVHLTVNVHRDYYEKAADYLANPHISGYRDEGEGIVGCDPETMEVMIDKDTIVELQFYPETPISFYKILHYDIEIAIDLALEVMSIHENAQRERAGR